MPSFSVHRSSFRKVFHKEVVVWQNDVMRYSSSAPPVKSELAVYIFITNCTPPQAFFKEFEHIFGIVILKTPSQWMLFKIIVFWEHSWVAASQRQQRRYTYNPNSCNSKYHLDWTKSWVPSKSSNKLSYKNSYNSNPNDSKHHLSRTI